MRVYIKNNVYEEGKARINKLYDEFEEVFVWFSGGKDSTVLFNLTLEIAKERGKLPLKVGFLDQEAEWQHTIDYMQKIMNMKEVKPYWFQMPIRLFNASSYIQDWLYCWKEDEEKEWMRPKEDIAIKENIYGTLTFKELFNAIAIKEFGNNKVAFVGGVRCEESPARMLGLTAAITYKDITWGKGMGKKYPDLKTFYPLYDWSYTDIWKYIESNQLDYNKIYDYQYRYGIGINNMRVSNLHHETAVHALFYLQEVEPQTYEKLVKRLKGIDAAGKFGKSDFFVKELPFMFKNWIEYRDFLLHKLVIPEHRENFIKWFRELDNEFEDYDNYTGLIKEQVNTIIANDWNGTKIQNQRVRHSTAKTRGLAKLKIKNKLKLKN